MPRQGRAVAAAALLVAALSAACGTTDRPRQTAVPVTVATAMRRAVPFELDATGIVEPIQSVAVQSQVAGVLTGVSFKEGEDVKEGQVLFQIDPRSYEAARAQARGVLARDVAQFAQADSDARRASSLAARGYVTQQQYEQARATANSLRATLRADSGALATAELNLQYATLRAPISGRAGGLLVRPGNLVRANQTTPLVVINQVHPILVRFAVPATSLPALQRYRAQGPVVRVRPIGVGAAEAEGSLTFIDNAVDTTTGTILLKGSFANAESTLWPGQFVSVRLQLFVEQGALVIPSKAIVAGQQGSYVWVVTGDATAATRPVTIERTAGDLAIVVAGLAPGDRVVTDGQLRLRAGSKVEVITGADSSAVGAP
jgi:multidrug efflux system membrane fusion protein